MKKLSYPTLTSKEIGNSNRYIPGKGNHRFFCQLSTGIGNIEGDLSSRRYNKPARFFHGVFKKETEFS